jgi:hypothetical protein
VKLSAAIEAVDISLVKELQEAIARCRSDETTNQVKDLQQELERNLDVIAACYRRRRARLLRSFHRRELEARRRMQAEFEETRRIQLLQLKELQSSLFEQYRAEMSKPNPRYNDLLEQARANAAHQDYARAQKDRDEAEVVYQAEIVRRRELFERSYKSRMAAALKKQDAELDALQKRSRDEIGDIEKEREAELAKDLAVFKKDLVREYRTRTGQIASQVKRPVAIERRFAAECLNGLEDTYRNALARFGLAPSEETKRPPLIVVSAKGESVLPLRMQSRLDSRARTASFAPKGTGSRSSRRVAQS